MEALLDFSKPFDPSLLDQIINVFYTPRHPEVGGGSIGIICFSRRKPVQVLYDFKEKDRAWSFADRIIEQCKDPRSVFYGLIVGMEVEWDA